MRSNNFSTPSDAGFDDFLTTNTILILRCSSTMNIDSLSLTLSLLDKAHAVAVSACGHFYLLLVLSFSYLIQN